MMVEKEIFAVELNGLHIGLDAEVIKQYRYGGEDRTKQVVLGSIRYVYHYGTRVAVEAKEPLDYYSSSYNLKIDDKVIIRWEQKEEK